MNYKNFNRVLTYIERNPHEWQQWNFMGDQGCGCFAYHALRIMGEGGVATIEKHDRIARWLGVSFGQFSWLFSAQTQLDDFRRMRLAAGYANFAR